MRAIELRTRDGRPDDFVAVVEIPPFPDAAMPDVVVWGARVFVQAFEPSLDEDEGACRMHDGRWVYREAFAFISRTPKPGLSR